MHLVLKKEEEEEEAAIFLVNGPTSISPLRIEVKIYWSHFQWTRIV